MHERYLAYNLFLICPSVTKYKHEFRNNTTINIFRWKKEFPQMSDERFESHALHAGK